ncbi:transposable element Tcb2 transposase [Trichonephila clavipes]|nr:transposable element Tcb2 transposase [Trichonephila clavipes]
MVVKVGNTRPLPGRSNIGSISAKHNFVLECLHPPRSPTREAVCRSSSKYQARRLPGVHPEYSTTASGRGFNGSVVWTKKEEKEKWDDKKRVENREGSLGYPGGGGLYARRPVVCVPFTRQHRTARLQWCREHHNWTEQDWACVLFADESRFSLSSDCRRQLIWREIGTAYRPENILEKDRYTTYSIMVWAGIMINGRTRQHVAANGTMTGQRYIDEVLLPHVRLFRGAVGDKLVFMEDNATCHRTLAVQDF